jgi:hypothetical protein
MPTSEASGRATPHRLLRWTLALGAAYDIFFALLRFTVPERASHRSGLPLAEPRFYIRPPGSGAFGPGIARAARKPGR